jgi:cytochrome c biogenesis protein CcdA
MFELIPALVPLLIVDVLNPVLFALLVLAVSSAKPIANSVAFLSGHTLAYFISGVVIALGLEQITDRLSHPLPVDFIIELCLGLLCLWAAVASRDGKASEEKNPERPLTPAYCFGYGAIINFIGVPFALPYFAATDQILKANVSVEASVLALAIYNIAYALPFLLVPIAVAVVGERCKPILEKISNLLVSLVDKVMPIMLLTIGAALSADAITYLVSGEPLW